MTAEVVAVARRNSSPTVVTNESLQPGSSQGVEKAIASAEHAAVTLNTLLDDPMLSELAFAHHACWEAGLRHAQDRTSSPHHARGTRFAAQPFWTARSQSEPEISVEPPHDALLRKRDGLASASCLRRASDRFVVEDGIIGPVDAERLARLVTALVLPLLAAFAEPITIEGGVERAGHDPCLPVLSRRAVREAALELLRRGALTIA